MYIRTYFHANYASQTNYVDEHGITDYVKISFVCDGLGTFCVIGNVKTGKTQCQKYPLKNRSDAPNERNFVGVDYYGLYVFEKYSISSIADYWGRIKKEKRDGILRCLGELSHSAELFCNAVNATNSQCDDIKKRVNAVHSLFYELETGKQVIIGLAKMKRDFAKLKNGNYYPVAVNYYSISDYRLLADNGKSVYVKKNDADIFLDETT